MYILFTYKDNTKHYISFIQGYANNVVEIRTSLLLQDALLFNWRQAERIRTLRFEFDSYRLKEAVFLIFILILSFTIPVYPT